MVSLNRLSYINKFIYKIIKNNIETTVNKYHSQYLSNITIKIK